MVDKTQTKIVYEGGETFDWADCPVQDCTNRICLALESSYCYPHTSQDIKDRVEKVDIKAGK